MRFIMITLLLVFGTSLNLWAADLAKFELLDTPAIQTPLAEKMLINGLIKTGNRIIAVGQRGDILWSDDHGRTWTQAGVPASVDLTAVTFTDKGHGLAVGHDGLILRSFDAGQTWTRAQDGRSSGAHSSNGQNDLGRPFLDVYLDADQHGYAVGAFGYALETRDGGKTWQDFSNQLNNKEGLHLYGVRLVNGALYVVGEQGFVARQMPDNTSFERLDTGYKGSFFGVVGNPNGIWVYGLRGTLMHSTDQGEHWKSVVSGVVSSITSATVANNGDIYWVTSTGDILCAKAQSDQVSKLDVRVSQSAAAVVATSDNTLEVGGLGGLARVQLKQGGGVQ